MNRPHTSGTRALVFYMSIYPGNMVHPTPIALCQRATDKLDARSKELAQPPAMFWLLLDDYRELGPQANKDAERYYLSFYIYRGYNNMQSIIRFVDAGLVKAMMLTNYLPSYRDLASAQTLGAFVAILDRMDVTDHLWSTLGKFAGKKHELYSAAHDAHIQRREAIEVAGGAESFDMNDMINQMIGNPPEKKNVPKEETLRASSTMRAATAMGRQRDIIDFYRLDEARRTSRASSALDHITEMYVRYRDAVELLQQ